MKIGGSKLTDFDIESAFFTNHGEEIICTGARNHFYSYNLGSGDFSRSVAIRG